MSFYKTFYSTAEIEASLEEWSDEELIEELQERGVYLETTDNPEEANRLLHEIWQLRRLGKTYDHLMDDFIYNALGKLI